MMRGHRTYTAKGAAENDAGFSLLETLIALAILSLVSLASYQSLAQLTGLSARAGAATERTVDGVLARAVFTDLVTDITPNWREESQGAYQGDFRGNVSGFSARSGRVPAIGAEGLAPFVMRATEAGLVVEAAGTTTTLRAAPARLLYLGTDAQWRESWPPDAPLSFGPADAIAATPGARDHLLTRPPSLPAAVRADFADGVVWLAALRTAPDLPPRAGDAL